MEPRTITVVSTREQINVELTTGAETLGQLKEALRNNNIAYDGMTFFEGLTHVELIGDDAVLPHDVNYKGEVTNHIVIMLTNSNKKIRSGAIEDRIHYYDYIKAHNLENMCKEKYGKIFTQCSNKELRELITPNSCSQTNTSGVAKCDECSNVAKAIFAEIATLLCNHNILSEKDTKDIVKVMGFDLIKDENKAKYSNSDIEEMFEFLN